MHIHGGNIISVAASLGCNVGDLIDMSGNLTPLEMVPGLREVICKKLDEISYLPETGSETLRRIFARKFGLNENEVLVGNGTTEFIFALPYSFTGRHAIIINPTYSDYRLACQWAHVDAEDFMLQLEQDFRLDLDRLATRLHGGELVFICNPNNPTGALTPTGELHKWISHHRDTFFLVDESYLPFTREKSLLHYNLPPNLFVLFSSSKIYGIPGLRLGFLVSKADNLKALNLRRKPWGVNRIAQIAGEYLFEHADPYVEKVQNFIQVERSRFIKSLKNIRSIRVVPGEANFVLCQLLGQLLAPELQTKMLEKHIMIRNCETFTGLDDHYFRVSLKGKEANDFCIKMLQDIIV